MFDKLNVKVEIVGVYSELHALPVDGGHPNRPKKSQGIWESPSAVLEVVQALERWDSVCAATDDVMDQVLAYSAKISD